MSKLDYAPYVGVPFVNNGRHISGFDCWGLVKELYLKQHNVDLPDFIYTEAEGSSIGLFFTDELFVKSVWELVPSSEGTIAVFMIAGAIRHVGYMINSHQFIHTISGCATVIEDIKGPKWGQRFKGCYRWRQN